MDIVNSGKISIPALGFGTYRMNSAEVMAILPEALKLGFRHVDTAQIYNNQAAVGAAIKKAGVARGEIFLTTKVWVTNFDPNDFLSSVEKSLARLEVDHVDLLLLHWPEGSSTTRERQIEELNKAACLGMTRYIGVSNYSSAQMREAARLSPTPLVTNQVEYHPYLSQHSVLAACRDLDMSLTAYFAMADGKVPRDRLLGEIGNPQEIGCSGSVAMVDTAGKCHRIDKNSETFTAGRESGSDMEAINALAGPDGRFVSPSDLAPIWD